MQGTFDEYGFELKRQRAEGKRQRAEGQRAEGSKGLSSFTIHL
jgi:hypothetical protein